MAHVHAVWGALVSSTAIAMSAVFVQCSSSSNSASADSGSAESVDSAAAADTSAGSDGASTPEAGRVTSIACSAVPGPASPDAGTCITPESVCCEDYVGSRCTAPADCKSTAWSCTGPDDCSGGDLCCFQVSTAAGLGSVTCQPGPKCPKSPLFGAQVCKTSADCSGGAACLLYNCSNLLIAQFCEGTIMEPSPVCYVVADAGAESGAADTGVVESGVTEAGVADSGATESGVAESGATD